MTPNDRSGRVALGHVPLGTTAQPNKSGRIIKITSVRTGSAPVRDFEKLSLFPVSLAAQQALWGEFQFSKRGATIDVVGPLSESGYASQAARVL